MSTPTTTQDQIRQDAHERGLDYSNATAAAAYLGKAEQTLRNWRVKSRGPRYQKAGGQVRYYFVDLDAWLDAGYVDVDAAISTRS